MKQFIDKILAVSFTEFSLYPRYNNRENLGSRPSGFGCRFSVLMQRVRILVDACWRNQKNLDRAALACLDVTTPTPIYILDSWMESTVTLRHKIESIMVSHLTER